MSNKKTYIFLLPAVVVIWSIISYKIFNAIHTKDIVNPAMVGKRIAKINKPSSSAVSFELIEVERDPFLNKVYKKKKLQYKSITHKKVEWPSVDYLGLVTTSNDGGKIAILQINNEEVLLQIGDEFMGVKLLAANSNNSKVRYKYQNRSLSK